GADLGKGRAEDPRHHRVGQSADGEPAEWSLGVGGVEQGDAVLRRPCEPVEEALLAGALLRDRLPAQALGAARVVGADVEEAVELVDTGREVRQGANRVTRSTRPVIGARPRAPDERPERGAGG